MSYVIISTQIRTEVGPTLCGDEFQDQDLMNWIGATLQRSMDFLLLLLLLIDVHRNKTLLTSFIYFKEKY